MNGKIGEGKNSSPSLPKLRQVRSVTNLIWFNGERKEACDALEGGPPELKATAKRETLSGGGKCQTSNHCEIVKEREGGFKKCR